MQFRAVEGMMFPVSPCLQAWDSRQCSAEGIFTGFLAVAATAFALCLLACSEIHIPLLFLAVAASSRLSLPSGHQAMAMAGHPRHEREGEWDQSPRAEARHATLVCKFRASATCSQNTWAEKMDDSFVWFSEWLKLYSKKNYQQVKGPNG